MAFIKRCMLALVAAGLIMGLVAYEKEGPLEKAKNAVDESVEKAKKAEKRIKEKTDLTNAFFTCRVQWYRHGAKKMVIDKYSSDFHRLDHRMHDKVMIVDNRIAIIDGRNLADKYVGLHTKANFRDLELLAGGPIVRELSTSFDEYFNDDWSFPIDGVAYRSKLH